MKRAFKTRFLPNDSGKKASLVKLSPQTAIFVKGLRKIWDFRQRITGKCNLCQIVARKKKQNSTKDAGFEAEFTR